MARPGVGMQPLARPIAGVRGKHIVRHGHRGRSVTTRGIHPQRP